MPNITEKNLTAQSLIDWLQAEGYEYKPGPALGFGQPEAEREDSQFRDVVLKGRLLGAVRRLNPQLPPKQAQAVVDEIAAFTHADLVLGNKQVYGWLSDGYKKEWRENGEEKFELVKLVDYEHPEANDFLVSDEVTVRGIDTLCRFDVIVFVNGLPLAVFELKSAVHLQATVAEAYRQMERYKAEIPKLFLYNQIIGLSDLNHARHGTITSPFERFAAWKGIEAENDRPKNKYELEILTKGLFNKKRLIDVLQNFIVFESDSDGTAVSFSKKTCLYHQYYGVNKVIESTMRAVEGHQDHKIGVFWHTQGSGKSLSMVFYVNKTRRIEALKSPAYVFLTDREDLDGQLHRLFKRVGYGSLAHRAETIADLRTQIREFDLGVSRLVFSTIQKFSDYKDEFKEFSSRENIIVLADEAHRTQYASLAGNARKALPNASFLAVTGTPIAAADGRNTERVFGKIVSSYKISQAVEDEATVRIYYEGRLAPLHVADQFIDQKINAFLDEIPEDERAPLQKEMAALEVVVGHKERVKRIAQDVVEHFKSRPLDGKAMVVTMSRRIAIDMYEEIRKIPGAPECAVVISGFEEFRERVQAERDVAVLEKRFKKDSDPLRLVIVCSMWLTGFDVPSMHTMYLDKPLKNHGLMQAIARVNRVYKDKPAGLIVDYIGVAEHLKKALAMYGSEISFDDLSPLHEAIMRMKSLYQKVANYFGNLDFSGWRKKKGGELSELMFEAMECVLTSKEGLHSDDRKMEYFGAVATLSKIHAFVMPDKEAMEILADVQFFQAVKQNIAKLTVVPRAIFPEESESAIRSLIDEAIGTEDIIDLFKKNSEKGSISIFDPNFEKEISKVRFKNLAADVVRKLLDREIVARMKNNKARYEPMLETLKQLIEKYENNVISSAEIIKKLVEIALEIKKLDQESLESGLSEEEIIFYDTLSRDPELKKEGIDLKELVRELISRIRRDLAIDWMNNDVIKARIRQNVRLLLIQKGIQEQMQERLIDAIYQETIRVYREYIPV